MLYLELGSYSLVLRGGVPWPYWAHRCGWEADAWVQGDGRLCGNFLVLTRMWQWWKGVRSDQFLSILKLDSGLVGGLDFGSMGSWNRWLTFIEMVCFKGRFRVSGRGPPGFSFGHVTRSSWTPKWSCHLAVTDVVVDIREMSGQKFEFWRLH